MSLRSCPNSDLLDAAWDAELQRPGLWYRCLRRVLQVTFSALWGVRIYDRHHEPATGSAVYIANHQSFLDPVLMSMALQRPMNYMARDSLFRIGLFRRLIESLNAFPVRRGRADTAALKEAMRRLRSGGQVVVFAEGTRTRDGAIGPFLPGVAMLSKRAAEWTVPVLIDGAFDVWPRWKALPGSGRIVVRYGEPIHRSDAARRDPAEFVADVRERIVAMQTDLRNRLGWDAPPS